MAVRAIGGDLLRMTGPRPIIRSGGRRLADGSMIDELRIDTLSAGGAPAELAPGAMIARFRIEDRLGAGAMGVVYRARDEQLGRRVAVKLVGSAVGPAAENRFLREAQVMARLAHPNIAMIHEAGAVGGRLFIAMELIEGETVAAWLARPRPRRDVLALFLQAGRGLAAAHAAGVVHRDFKPANVLVGDGRARVVDFGLASVVDDLADDEPATGATAATAATAATPAMPTALGSVTLTQTGAVVGTPAYMAPEQRAGGRATEASDQYSFCVALWEGLAGARPPSTATGRRIPRAVRRVLERGLRDDPAERWPSVPALLDALTAAARAPVIAAGALGGAAAIAVVAVALAGHGGASAAKAGCGPARDQLAGLWDPARKTAMHAAFTATGLPSAESQWHSVEQALDRYTTDWVTRADAVCRDDQRHALPPPAIAARRSCLDRHLDHLRGWVSVFAAADASLVQDAARASTELEDLAVCDDVDEMSEIRPADPALAARARELDEHVMAADLRASYQDYNAGVGELRGLLAQAKQLAYQPMVAQVLQSLAHAQQTASEYKDAIATWLEVRDLAEATHQDMTRARAWAGLAFAYANLSELDQAHDAVRVGLAIVQQLHSADAKQIRSGLTECDALAYWSAGQLDHALELLQGVEREQHEIHESDPFRIAGVEVDLGGLLSDMGRYDEAGVYLARALQRFLDQDGDAHPAVAAIVNNQGNLYFFAGDYARAAERYREAIAVRDRAGIPADNLGRGFNLLNLGESLIHLAKFDDAFAALDRARAILAAKLGEDKPEFAELSTWLGLAELGRNHPTEAAAALDHAVTVYRAGEGTKPADLAEAQFGLARALWDGKAPDHRRARALATDAAAGFTAGKLADRASEVKTWLADHTR